MKRTITIILILIISAAVAFCWVAIDTALTKKTHPLEYRETVEMYAKEYSVPKELIYAVIKAESKFKSDVVSKAGAIGLMQITPDTFTWLCTKNQDSDNSVDRLYNPETNIKYGVFYLDMLYSEFGSWETALAAYNAGPSNVRDWLKNSELSKDGVITHIPFKETREYVEKVMTAKATYSEIYSGN